MSLSVVLDILWSGSVVDMCRCEDEGVWVCETNACLVQNSALVQDDVLPAEQRKTDTWTVPTHLDGEQDLEGTQRPVEVCYYLAHLQCLRELASDVSDPGARPPAVAWFHQEVEACVFVKTE